MEEKNINKEEKNKLEENDTLSDDSKNSSSQSTGDLNKKNSEIDSLKKQCEEYLDGWKRTKADFINYKKDESKRLDSILKFSNETIIKDLLSVLDSFDLAIQSFGKDSKLEKGVYLIRSQMEDVLKKYGLERIIVSVGQQFDPALHEAIAVIESNEPSGTVVDEVERGYMLSGKLIRAARVRVSK